MHRQSYRWIRPRVIKTGPTAGATPYVYGFADNDTVHSVGPWLLLGIIILLPLYTYSSFRIKKEEEVLLRDLSGYKDYYIKTRFSLIPLIW